MLTELALIQTHYNQDAVYQPWVIHPNVVALEVAAPETPPEVRQHTSFIDLQLPLTAHIFTDQGTEEDVKVLWNQESYDAGRLGLQTITGTVNYRGAMVGGVQLHNRYRITPEFQINVIEKPETTIPQLVAGDMYLAGLSNLMTVYGEGYIEDLDGNLIDVAEIAREWNALPVGGKVKKIFGSNGNLAGITQDGKVVAAGIVASYGANAAAIAELSEVEDVALNDDLLMIARMKDGSVRVFCGINSEEYTSAKNVVETWTNINVITVGIDHIAAVTKDNGTKAYSISDFEEVEQGSVTAPPWTNISTWVASESISKMISGGKYTAGLSSVTGRLRIAGEAESGAKKDLVVPDSIINYGNSNIQQIKPGEHCVLLIFQDGRYGYISTYMTTNQILKIPTPYKNHSYNATGENVWKDLFDIAGGSDFIAGLKKDGSVVIDGEFSAAASWNLGTYTEE